MPPIPRSRSPPIPLPIRTTLSAHLLFPVWSASFSADPFSANPWNTRLPLFMRLLGTPRWPIFVRTPGTSLFPLSFIFFSFTIYTSRCHPPPILPFSTSPILLFSPLLPRHGFFVILQIKVVVKHTPSVRSNRIDGVLLTFREGSQLVVKVQEDSSFEAAFQRWMETQIRQSKGERRARLKKGLGHAEYTFVSRLWWPAFGNLDHLHAEFEVHDFKDGVRYLDFAFILPGLKLCIEIDGFSTHGRNLTRWQFDDQLDRQNDLILDDWKILRFSYDRIKENPRYCQQKLLQALGRWGARKPELDLKDPIDLSIVNLMSLRGCAMSPTEISKELGWRNNTIAIHLKQLSQKHLVVPAKTNAKRTTRYVLNIPSSTGNGTSTHRPV